MRSTPSSSATRCVARFSLRSTFPSSGTVNADDAEMLAQMEVHGEPASKVSAKGFRRFLCDTPLDVRRLSSLALSYRVLVLIPLTPRAQIEPTHSPNHSYGSHHALYRLDGHLIAFAVLDLLPRAVSSVYFVWNPDYAAMSLGKISALREAQLAREMDRAGAWEQGEGRYMMGACSPLSLALAASNQS